MKNSVISRVANNRIAAIVKNDHPGVMGLKIANKAVSFLDSVIISILHEINKNLKATD